MLTKVPRYHKTIIKETTKATYSCFLLHQNDECLDYLRSCVGYNNTVLFIYPVTNQFPEKFDSYYWGGDLIISTINKFITSYNKNNIFNNIVVYGYDIIDDKLLNKMIYLIAQL